MVSQNVKTMNVKVDFIVTDKQTWKFSLFCKTLFVVLSALECVLLNQGKQKYYFCTIISNGWYGSITLVTIFERVR